MSLAVAAAVFPVIFLGELPDKTMFASLVLATRGRPRAVWIGAAAAFLVHVVIAVTAGLALFSLLPHRAVEAVVAGLFLFGAVYAFRLGSAAGGAARQAAGHMRSRHRVVVTAFVVIFLAEWGDLTQVLTVNLAAHYRAPLAVGVGSVAALWAVAGLAVTGGQGLLRWVDIGVVRRVTALVLLILAAVAAYSAAF